MSDKTSAEIFGTMFKFLAQDPTDYAKAMAKQVWDFSMSYDFAYYQMNCDKALIQLGLARKAQDGIDYGPNP